MAAAARQSEAQCIGYLRKQITFADDGVAVTVGVVPAGAIIHEAWVHVSTAFNAGTTNVLDIGTSADDDGFATNLALGTIGKIVWDELATSNDLGPMAADTTIIATPDLTGTAATAGTAQVVVTFIPNNDG